MDDDKAKESYAKDGVDLPELKEAPKDEPKDEPKEEPEKEPTEDAEDKSDEHLQPTPNDQEPRKRSIYDQYKDKKAELKSERELREAAEQKAAELQQKLDALSAAKSPEAKSDAQDEIDRFLSAHKELDKEAISDLLTIARKGVKAEIDPDLKARLERFETWEKSTATEREKSLFNAEFERTLPQIKELYPSISDEELQKVKGKLDDISHTKEFHDKELDYIIFKSRDALAPLVSPKKHGLESKSTRKGNEHADREFDPAPDFSKMSADELAQWEKQYRDAGKPGELITDGQGKKIII